MHSALIVWTTMWFGATPVPDSDSQFPPLSPAVVEQLASGSYAQRQAAMEQLWAAGDASVALLEEALRHKSAEVRYRAQFVLDNLRSGITHDTPNSVLREIYRFRSDLVEDRRRAMQKLEAAGRPRIVLSLMQSEADARLREEWSLALERSLVRSIAAGELDEVTDTLRRSAASDTWSRHWAAFALQRGIIDAELSRPQSPATDLEADRARVFLLRAKGELAEAAQLAGGISDDLRLALLTEHRDWRQVASMAATRVADLSPNEVEPEKLAFAAAAYRLAEMPSESDRILDTIRTHAEDVLARLAKLDPNYYQQQRELVNRNWHFAKGLLLNGRYDEAIDLMRVRQAPFVFELLCEQQRFEEAFASVGLKLARGPDPEWFRNVALDSARNQEAFEQQFSVAQIAIRQLAFLGRRDEAVESLQILLESARGDRDTRRLRVICETAMKLPAIELAFEIGSVILEREDNPSAIALLFPSRAGMATVWWEFFQSSEDRPSIPQSLRRVDEVLKRNRVGASHDIEKLIADAAARANTFTDEEKVQCWHELAETARLYGRDELAAAYYTKAAETSTSDMLGLADLFAGQGKWSNAARWYERAWRRNQDKPLPLYLYGRALQRSGEEEKGLQLVERAILMPMANTELRQELASGLKERGYRDEARRQFELILRTGDFQDGRLIDAAKQVGNLVHSSDALRAANCWETMLLCCLKPHWAFVEKGGYIQIPHLVHKTRARGLLKAGQPDVAMKEAWASYRAAPANSELAEELVPLLQTANRPDDANELFAHSANRLAELIETFPQCATFHNNRAWLFARCGRDLNEALEHAERALELEPNRTMFVDTIGEVHFRLGNFDQAIEYAERCLKAEPQSTHFHAQVERYRSALKEKAGK